MHTQITHSQIDTGEKWVLIDLGQTVEIGSLTIQARSSSTSHITRITHMTVFTSDRDDTGFTFTGTPTGDTDENLVLGITIDQMKLDPSLKWRDLNGYSTNQTSNNYTKANQAEDTIAPVITSPNTVSVEENIGSEQVVYTTTASDNLDVANFSYEISGKDAFEFTIDPSTGEVSLTENPDFETKNSFTFEITATDVFGNTSIPFPVNLIITDVDEESPVITSGQKTRDLVSYDTNPLIYTIEATDNVAVSKYYFSGDELLGGTSYTSAYLNENNDYVILEINTISGNILFREASNYSNLPATYNFAVTAIDEKRNISDSLIVSLTIRNIERTIGETRYIMFRGTDDNGEFNNIGELDIFDVDGNDLIGNGTLNTKNFTYRYGGGYFYNFSNSNSIGDASSTTFQPGLNLFDNSVSSPYANNLFSESSGEKWVLIDLGQTVEVGSLTIQARSNSTSHINRITHMTVFTSNRNDTGFSYTGSASGDANEDLTLGRTINQMKSDTTLKWFDLDVFSSQATTREFIEPSIGIEPTITSSNSADNILENSGTGQLVYTAETSNDNGTVNYSIYGIAVNEFTINPNTGEVFLIENPDFETKNAYTFRVIATDNHGNTSTPHQVTFSVIDIDEEDPVITSSNSTNSIAENSGAGQEIYTVTASDNIGIDSYAITGTDASAFNIDTNTGVVTLIDNPDFETQESYTFEVTASDAAENTSAPQTVSLSITDIEDEEAPVITSASVANPIESNSGAGQEIYTVTASDNVGIDSYAISGTHANAFTIDTNTGVVTLTGNPDFETQESYTFEVTASDAAGNTSPPQNVSLAITDVDEEAPVITSSNSANSIAENSGAGQEIYTVTASDNIGIDSYAITGTDASAFNIDTNTGVVTLTGNPDFETQESYSFEVTASDAAGNTSAPQNVSLAVTDVDEEAPVITSPSVANPIAENSGAFQNVYTITGNDNIDIVSFNIQGNDADYFVINNISGSVIFIHEPDFETKETYTFEVTASDAAGNTSIPHQVSFSIIDIDEDEEAPVISSPSVANHIELNSGAGQEIYTVTASDNVGVTSYAISGTDSSAFTIDVITGVVTLIANPDHEVKNMYSFQVFAYDAQGNISEPKTVNLEVFADIIFVDEEAPVITSDSVANPIASYSGAGQGIYTVTASDNVGINSYAISGTDSSAFTIDETTGVVTLTENPDFASQETYNFEVTASDAAGNTSVPYNVSFSITYVEDLEAPVITSAAVADTITENSGQGQIIYQVTTSNDAAIASYNLVEENSDNTMLINNENGLVYLTINPNYEDKQTHTFGVYVRDTLGNIGPVLDVTLEVRRATKWGPVRYIMLRAIDSLEFALDELRLFDSLGNNLIQNYFVDKNNFTFRYGGGFNNFTSSHSADNLFQNTRDRFQSNEEIFSAEKWVLIDLGQEIEIDYFEIDGVYSDNPFYHQNLNQTTLFTSTRDDTGFAFTGAITNDATEDLQLGRTIDEMKADSTLKWQDIEGFTLWSNPNLDMIFNNPNR